MPFIDRTYFDGPLVLAVGSDVLRKATDAAIVEYEDEYLQKALGPSLYAAFMAGLAAESGGFSSGFSSGFQVSGLEDRWKWIRDGHTYSYNGRTYIWTGLVNARKQSPIAAYVYWHYQFNNATQTTSIGEKKAKSENADTAPEAPKMIRAWNRMVDWTKALAHMCAFLNAGATYPEFLTDSCHLLHYLQDGPLFTQLYRRHSRRVDPRIDVFEYQNSGNLV